MRKIAVMFFLFTLMAGCQEETMKETNSRMEGEPARLRVKGYEEMCAREPESPLCGEKNEGR